MGANHGNWTLPSLIVAGSDLAMQAVESGHPLIAFGRNPESEFLVKSGLAKALADDREIGGTFHGAPIVGLASLSNSDVLVNCSTSVAPIDVQAFLVSRTDARIIHYSELCHHDPERFVLPQFVQEFRAELANHESFYTAFGNQLADQESRQTLTNFIRYRAGFDLSAMKDYKVRLQDQYFESFVDLNGASFIDGGGFDGDTSEEVVKRFPGYSKIHFFGPSSVNMEKAKLRLGGYTGIEYHEHALSDVAGTLSFDPEGGSASQVVVGEGGLVQVSAVRLDDVVHGAVDFIKLDLEGWELKALTGAERIVRSSQPNLAIAIYHAAADLREIVAWARKAYDCMSLNFYLRHYTQGWSETILYVFPERTAKADA